MGETLREVQKLWPDRQIQCVHSIGLGGKAWDEPPSGPESADCVDAKGAARGRRKRFGWGMFQSLEVVVDTFGDTSQANRHAKSMLAAHHPTAKYRRLELPMGNVPVFMAKRDGYDVADKTCKDFLCNSSIFASMISDLVDPMREKSTLHAKDRVSNGRVHEIEPRPVDSFVTSPGGTHVSKPELAPVDEDLSSQAPRFLGLASPREDLLETANLTIQSLSGQRNTGTWACLTRCGVCKGPVA